ncbi:MAG TPA: hypothetical protein VKX25_14110 [Bryobacteraceae bacterium]|jgi:hypothetical protein|nr:hypothetical protein [Bryobacteraceae bacterium]
MNAVACCPECNGAKHQWDPNYGPLLYTGGELCYATRLALIERVRQYLGSHFSEPRRQWTRDGLAKAHRLLA